MYVNFMLVILLIRYTVFNIKKKINLQENLGPSVRRTIVRAVVTFFFFFSCDIYLIVIKQSLLPYRSTLISYQW